MTYVPRDPTLSPEMRRFLDEIARVTNIFDGTDAAASTALLNVFTSALQGVVPASGGGTVKFLRADATWASAGVVMQCLQTTYTTNADLTVTIPQDDTIPTNTEGTEILSRSITLSAASNKVLCLIELWGSADATRLMTTALFRGSTCIQAFGNTVFNANNPNQMAMNYLDAAGSVGPHTYAVRVGPTAGTLRLNGTTTTRLFGGASACTLTLMEIAA